jgi:hypothetical protein
MPIPNSPLHNCLGFPLRYTNNLGPLLHQQFSYANTYPCATDKTHFTKHPKLVSKWFHTRHVAAPVVLGVYSLELVLS